jgi:hypothetical protein
LQSNQCNCKFIAARQSRKQSRHASCWRVRTCVPPLLGSTKISTENERLGAGLVPQRNFQDLEKGQGFPAPGRSHRFYFFTQEAHHTMDQPSSSHVESTNDLGSSAPAASAAESQQAPAAAAPAAEQHPGQDSAAATPASYSAVSPQPSTSSEPQLASSEAPPISYDPALIAAMQQQQQHMQQQQQQLASLNKPFGAVKLFIGQIPKNMTEPYISPLFAPFGNLVEVAIIRNRSTGESRGTPPPQAGRPPPGGGSDDCSILT